MTIPYNICALVESASRCGLEVDRLRKAMSIPSSTLESMNRIGSTFQQAIEANRRQAAGMVHALERFGTFEHSLTKQVTQFRHNPALSYLMKPNPALDAFRLCFRADSALRDMEKRTQNAFGPFFHTRKRVDLPNLGRLNCRLMDSLVKPIPRIDADRILGGLNRESLYMPRAPLIRRLDLCQDVDVEEIQTCEPEAAAFTLWALPGL